MPPEIWNNITQLAVVGIICWSIITLYHTTLALARLETRVNAHENRLNAHGKKLDDIE